LPSDFRLDYGAEMERTFEEQRRAARGEEGRLGVVRLWTQLIGDIARTAPREHLAQLRQDLAYAWRGMRANAGLTSVIVVTLALGIGANTAIFSVVDSVLLRPSPIAGLDRLVMIWETDRTSKTTREPASVPDYLDFAERTGSLGRMAAFMGSAGSLTPPGGEATRLTILSVTHTLFPVLSVRPVMGRAFLPEDDGPAGTPVALISESLWRRAFGGRPDIVGATLPIDSVPYGIVGVVPDVADFGVQQILAGAAYGRTFVDREAAARVDVWLPLRPDPRRFARSTHPILVLGRLEPGVAPARAQEVLSAVASRLERTYPVNSGRGVFVEPMTDVVFGRIRPTLYGLMGGVGLLLLVACVNVANLLLARGATRVHEVAVRTSLGASWSRLARQFLSESLMLSLGAAAVGVGVAYLTLRGLMAIAPGGVPRMDAASLDLRVLLLTLVVATLVGVVFGTLPTLQAWRVNLQDALRTDGKRQGSGTRDGSRLRATLVVVEVAAAVVLVTAAGLLAKSYWRLEAVDAGFQTPGVTKAEFQLPGARYPASLANWPHFGEIHRFNQRLLDRAASLPGVVAAAVAGSHPVDPGFTTSFSIVGREAEARTWPEISIRMVSPGYFRTVGLPVVSGRVIRETDTTDGPPVLLMNEAAARRFFDRREPLGAHVAFWGVKRTIVGIVANERFQGLAENPPLAVYLPIAQAPPIGGAEVLLVRTAGSASREGTNELAAAIRMAVREQDSALAVFGLETLQQTVRRTTSDRRFATVLIGLFAFVALGLATIGVHGVLSYSVVQRTREIGIRMALGAPADTVRRTVMRQGVRLALLGLGVGLPLAVGATSLLGRLLFQTTAVDPATYAAVAVTLLVVAAAASYLPARRATSVDPLTALRAE
jgi:putative ABC transport system permease protein